MLLTLPKYLFELLLSLYLTGHNTLNPYELKLLQIASSIMPVPKTEAFNNWKWIMIIHW